MRFTSGSVRVWFSFSIGIIVIVVLRDVQVSVLLQGCVTGACLICAIWIGCYTRGMCCGKFCTCIWRVACNFDTNGLVDCPLDMLFLHASSVLYVYSHAHAYACSTWIQIRQTNNQHNASANKTCTGSHRPTRCTYRTAKQQARRTNVADERTHTTPLVYPFKSHLSQMFVNLPTNFVKIYPTCVEHSLLTVFALPVVCLGQKLVRMNPEALPTIPIYLKLLRARLYIIIRINHNKNNKQIDR